MPIKRVDNNVRRRLETELAAVKKHLSDNKSHKKLLIQYVARMTIQIGYIEKILADAAFWDNIDHAPVFVVAGHEFLEALQLRCNGDDDYVGSWCTVSAYQSC